MNNSTITQLIDQLKSEEVLLNEVQKQFIHLLSAESIDADALNAILVNPLLYENTTIENIENTNLSKEEWETIISKIKEEAPQPQSVDIDDSAQIMYYWVELIKDKRDVKINMLPNEKPIPNEVHKFIEEAGKVNSTINEIFEGDEEFKWLERLEGIVRVGSISTYSLLASTQLEKLKEDLVISNGNELKFNYLKESGKYVLILMGISFLLMLLEMKCKVIPLVNPIYFVNYLFVIIGTAIGSWLTFAITKREVSFDDLRVLIKTKKLPLLRLVVITLIATAFYFMFITDFINIKVGENFDTASLTNESAKNVAFLIGVFLGMSENSIGAKLTTKASSFITKL